MCWPANAFQRNDAKYSQGHACTRYAHTASQAVDIKRESYRSIIGAAHNRCDKLFIRLKFATFGRSNKSLEQLVILSPCEHDRLRWVTAWYSQIPCRIRLRGLSVHTQRPRVGHPVRLTSTRENARRPVSTHCGRRRGLARTAASCHNRTHTPQQIASLFDNLGGAGQQRRR